MANSAGRMRQEAGHSSTLHRQQPVAGIELETQLKLPWLKFHCKSFLFLLLLL